MKRWLSRLLSSPNSRPSSQRHFFRPKLETLERREVPSATSSFDIYFKHVVSAPGQERRADGFAFAIDAGNDLIVTDGWHAVNVSPWSPASDHGYAQDISAGRDIYGNAQCLVRGKDDMVSLWNITSGWQDLHYSSTLLAGSVCQVSASENGLLYVLDSKHLAWQYNGQAWVEIHDCVQEIQAPRAPSDYGLYIRDVQFHVFHETPSGGWIQLSAGNPYVQAHALSVAANGSVYILDQNMYVVKHILKGDYWQSGTVRALAIDACTMRDGQLFDDLIYAGVRPPCPPEGPPGSGCGGPLIWWAYQPSTGWRGTGIVTGDFSGSSGTTNVFAQLYDPSLLTDWYVDCIDWSWHHYHYICGTLSS